MKMMPRSLMSSMVILTAAMTFGCATQAAPRREALYPKVLVGPFTIESQPLPGGKDRPMPEVFPTLLANEAAASAERSLVRGHLAAVVERKPARNAAVGEAVITGTVRLPTSLPPGLHGLHADAQKGALATATLKLVSADGKILQQAEATFSWRDARWLTGPPKSRRVRPVETVLVEAVREVVARAAELLETDS